MADFVEGWSLYQTLGEGSYGKVVLSVHRETNKQIAVKFMEDSEENKFSIQREIKIHQALEHPNIVQLYGTRYLELHNCMYRCIFLEYLKGGELFDKIVPGKGLNELESFSYYQQILDGVEYLHKRGVTHRDIKPENLLIDDFNTVKIIDFGLATVFRQEHTERKMENYCGTPQYMSPEVCAKVPYNAQSAEIYTLGIVLVAMWTGTLPWMEPNMKLKEYNNWWSKRLCESPWNQLSVCQLDLVKKILKHKPSDRLTLSQIRQHKWCVECEIELSVPENEPHIWNSQPALGSESLEMANHPRQVLSQPANIRQILLDASCSAPSNSSASNNRYEDLVTRMTRFWVDKTNEEIIKILEETCTRLQYHYKKVSNVELSITTNDTQSRALEFHATIYRKEGNGRFERDCKNKHALIDFRLSKGDGLEFKCAFLKVEKKMHRYRVTIES